MPTLIAIALLCFGSGLAVHHVGLVPQISPLLSLNPQASPVQSLEALSTASPQARIAPPRNAPPSNAPLNQDANPDPKPPTPRPPSPAPQSKPSTRPGPQPNATPSAHQGRLRIANATEFPIRVALLARLDALGSGAIASSNTSPSKPSPSAADAAAYQAPAHWDFSPQEGGLRGMVVSLPGQQLQLRQGDILVAFAQDGSRRYWGPYVVGETDLPLWNSKSGEWSLVLQP